MSLQTSRVAEKWVSKLVLFFKSSFTCVALFLNFFNWARGSSYWGFRSCRLWSAREALRIGSIVSCHQFGSTRHNIFHLVLISTVYLWCNMLHYVTYILYSQSLDRSTRFVMKISWTLKLVKELWYSYKLSIERVTDEPLYSNCLSWDTSLIMLI